MVPKNTSCQSFGTQRLFVLLTLTACIFGTIRRCNVPNFKGLISGNLELKLKGVTALLPSATPFLKRPFYRGKGQIVPIFLKYTYLHAMMIGDRFKGGALALEDVVDVV